jgi:hypothetical protein
MRSAERAPLNMEGGVAEVPDRPEPGMVEPGGGAGREPGQEWDAAVSSVQNEL